jgi:2-polyprenyl-3-methyl-5-hydroxy-6-metoxy-1,4-benzoquinol methylase
MSKQAANSPPLQAAPCEVCRSSQSRLLFTTHDRLNLSQQSFQIIECEGCGVLRTWPEMGAEELAKFYPNEYWGGVPTEGWIQHSQADKTSFLKQCQLAKGEILDVGCGAGFFLRALSGEGWVTWGVEIGAQAAQAAGRFVPEHHVFRGTLEEAGFADAKFDVVTFWSSLEHTNEPRANLLEARRILRPGGSVIVQVPNAASYQATLFKGDWFALDAPRHRYHFTPESLQRILRETGFSIYKTTFLSRAHNTHALRQSLKFKLWQRSPLHRAAFLLAIPFLKPFDFLMSTAQKGATITVAARAE